MTRSGVLAALLAAVPWAAAAEPASPIHLRLVEANTSACEWGGEATFTCRELVPPVALDLAFEPRGGRSVVVTVDGETTTEVTSPGSVMLGALAPGAHRLGVALVEEGGIAGFRRELRIDVGKPRGEADLPPPYVRIASPATGALLAEDATIEVHAYNPRSHQRAVGRVELLVDGRILEARTAEPWTFRWRTADAGPGRHEISARAQGARGLWSEARVEVVVLARRSLLAPSTVAVASGTPVAIELTVPAGVRRALLRTSLGVRVEAPGTVRAVLRDSRGREQGLFALATPVEPAVPFERDLAPWAGQTVALVVSADGGARATLAGLEAIAYE